MRQIVLQSYILIVVVQIHPRTLVVAARNSQLARLCFLSWHDTLDRHTLSTFMSVFLFASNGISILLLRMNMVYLN
ncbi:hypothetical protein F5Y18DRAFT_370082 [Xylariaceae sp. FL1019]|nr:hypothetical protein F5Y18DRAFT_370082 [Xylariaceae sp. FL1019]